MRSAWKVHVIDQRFVVACFERVGSDPGVGGGARGFMRPRAGIRSQEQPRPVKSQQMLFLKAVLDTNLLSLLTLNTLFRTVPKGLILSGLDPEFPSNVGFYVLISLSRRLECSTVGY